MNTKPAGLDDIKAIIRRTREDPAWYVKEVLKENIWATKAFDMSDVIRSVFKNRVTAVKTAHGVSKDLRLDEPIPTPEGWKLNGDLEVGDYVFSPHGTAIKVTEVHPINLRDEYEVEFTDGAKIVCGPGHLWNVLTLNQRSSLKAKGKRGLSREYPTDWRDEWGHSISVEAEKLPDILVQGKQRNLAVPLTKAIPGGYWPEPCLPPYMLGLWLGDGTTSNATMTTADEEIRDYCWDLAGRRGGQTRDGTWINVPFLPFGAGNPTLRALGLLNNKHVPGWALRASPQDRLAIVQGLMDSDGWSRGDGSVHFCTTDENIREGIRELVVSLGWSVRVTEHRATLDGRDCGPCWKVNFRPDVCPFRLKRKAENWKPSSFQQLRHTARTIKSVRKTGKQALMRCITVEASDGLYLAGVNMVPTHNSFTAARIAQAWMDAYPASDAKNVSTRVYTTAPTLRQVKDILWSEIPAANRKANEALGWGDQCFKLQMDRASNWFVHGFTATSTNEQAFHGLHATNMLIIVDEACGVSDIIMKQVRACSTGENNKVLLIGNPIDPTSNFAKYWDPDRDLTNIGLFTVSAWDTPNFQEFGIRREDFPTGEWRNKITGPLPCPYLVTPQWVADVWDDVKSFDDPYWIARVEGEFPNEHENQLIPTDWITKARFREVRPEHDAPRTFGLDVGEEGPDEAPLMDNWGGKCRLKFAIKTGRLNKLWDATERAYYGTNPRPDNVNVDATGVGAGVYDRLVEMGLPAQRMIMSHSATDNEVFANKRAEWWWHTRKRFDPDDAEFGHMDIDENDEKLERQLMSIRYDTKDGRRRIESKKDARKRGVKSPDRADALMLSCAPVSDTPQGGSVWLSG